jgi:hypothetical protein
MIKYIRMSGYILAGILGIYLAYLFVNFLSTRIDFNHPTDTQRLLISFGSIAFGVLAYLSLFASLSKRRKGECKKHHSPNEVSSSPSQRTFYQVLKAIVTQCSRNDKTEESKKYPACVCKKAFHFLLSIISPIHKKYQPRLYLTWLTPREYWIAYFSKSLFNIRYGVR